MLCMADVPVCHEESRRTRAYAAHKLNMASFMNRQIMLGYDPPAPVHQSMVMPVIRS